MKFAFVILHFITVEDTQACIESITTNVTGEEYDIVVVENGSPQGDITPLMQTYESESNIHFVISKENLGFPRGNNLGFQFAKKKLGSDFILLLNNDTIIEQANFLTYIRERYEQSRFDILGPRIISLADSQDQSPILWIRDELPVIAKQCASIHVKYGLFKLRLLDPILALNQRLRPKKESNSDRKATEVQHNVPLHGSCMVFSPDYVRKFRGLFSQMFMFVDEAILYHIARKEGLEIVYDPAITIYHKEDSATEALLGRSRAKQEFFLKESCRSLRAFLRLALFPQVYRNDLSDTES